MIIKGVYKNGSGHKLYNIQPENVTHVEQNKDYHLVHFTDREEPIEFLGPLTTAENRFPTFIKAHRSYLINPIEIFSVSNNPNNMVKVVFKNQKDIVFSKSAIHHPNFLQQFQERNGGYEK
jgi:DNA-binding LytR/AlgR family response regulator